jgi:hypothetical protein
MSTRSLAVLSLALSSILAVPGCKKPDAADSKDAKKDGKDAKADAKKDGKDAKADAKADEKADAGEEGSLQVADGDAAIEGPVPPETSAVFYGVEGALYPLACFDKDKKKLLPGSDCLALVAAGTDVRIASKFSSFNKKAGALTEPTCMAGTGKKVAIAVEGITQGADFAYGTWPPSAIKIVALTGDDTTSPPKTVPNESDKDKLVAAAGGGELMIDQIAEADLDGDGKADKVITAHVPNPALDEVYKWSGVLVARGGDFGKLEEVVSLKNKPDAFEVRGSLDLDGDKSAELWVRRTSQDGGAGDTVFAGPGGKWKRVGGWSCGIE